MTILVSSWPACQMTLSSAQIQVKFVIEVAGVKPQSLVAAYTSVSSFLPWDSNKEQHKWLSVFTVSFHCVEMIRMLAKGICVLQTYTHTTESLGLGFNLIFTYSLIFLAISFFFFLYWISFQSLIAHFCITWCFCVCWPFTASTVLYTQFWIMYVIIQSMLYYLIGTISTVSFRAEITILFIHPVWQNIKRTVVYATSETHQFFMFLSISSKLSVITKIVKLLNSSEFGWWYN